MGLRERRWASKMSMAVLSAPSAMVCVYQAYARFPMGDTSAISNSNVVWTSLIAYVVLKEKLHWLDLVAIPLTIVGILFFAQPSFIFGANDNTEFSTLGLVFSLASAVLAASCFNIIRKIGKDVHFTVTVMYYSIMGAVITGLIVYATTGFHLPCRSELGYLILSGQMALSDNHVLPWHCNARKPDALP